MTADTRKKMLERVKAILAKTMDNGCTESEAMAALSYAHNQRSLAMDLLTLIQEGVKGVAIFTCLGIVGSTLIILFGGG